METYRFEAALFLWDAATKGSWYFVTVPADVSEDVRFEAGEPRGFGSVRVEARIGATVWRTSVFPSDRESGCFVLPVKKAVRVAEDLDEGDVAAVELRVLEN